MWKQPKHPLMEEWIKKLWYMQWNVIQPLKKNELLPFATAQLDLEGIVLSETKYQMLSLLWESQNNNSSGTESGS